MSSASIRRRPSRANVAGPSSASGRRASQRLRQRLGGRPGMSPRSAARRARRLCPWPRRTAGHVRRLDPAKAVERPGMSASRLAHGGLDRIGPLPALANARPMSVSPVERRPVKRLAGRASQPTSLASVPRRAPGMSELPVERTAGQAHQPPSPGHSPQSGHRRASRIARHIGPIPIYFHAHTYL